MRSTRSGRGSILPGYDLRFTDAPPHYNFSHDTVMFEAAAGPDRVLCQISREALDDHCGTDHMTREGRLDVFRKHRREIQEMAQVVYLHRPLPADGAVLITTAEVTALRQHLKHRLARPA